MRSMVEGARGRTLSFAAAALAVAAAFLALGVWQIERRAWKLDLISRVEARLAAPAVEAPGAIEWPSISRAKDEYRRVMATGRFLPAAAVRVMAVTERGPGSWLLAPFMTTGGDTILVNRGFVPPDWSPESLTKNRDPSRRHAEERPQAASRSTHERGASFETPAAQAPQDDEVGSLEQGDREVLSGQVVVSGLLRLSEPGGGFLRSNDATAGRWYSRDVEAIAGALGLGAAAPYFIDADASANAPGRPVGGLTVVAFRNHHLIYALTWFALAALSLAAAIALLRGRAVPQEPDRAP